MLARVTTAARVGEVLRNLPDGGLLLHAHGTFSRLDVAGRLLWDFVREPSSLVKTEPNEVTADDLGAVWYFDPGAQFLRKLGVDGEIVFTHSAAELGLREITSISVSPSGQRALVAGIKGEPGQPLIASSLLSPSGDVLSTWTGPAALGSGPEAVRSAVLDDEHAFVVAIDSQERLLVAFHDAAGTATPPQTLSNLDLNPGIRYIKTTSNRLVVATSHIQYGFPFSSTSWQRHYFYSETGQLLSDDAPSAGADPTVDQDGVLWSLAERFGDFGSSIGWELVKMTPTGVTQIHLPTSIGRSAFIAATPHEGNVTIANGTQLYRVSSAGEVTSQQPYSATVPMNRVLGTTSDDGSSFIIQSPAAAQGSSTGTTLSRIAHDGRLQWAVSLVGEFNLAGYAGSINSNLIAANAGRVCYLPYSTILYCRDASDGRLLTRTPLPEGSYDSIALDADNRVLLYQYLGGAAPILVLAADQSQLPQSAYTAAMLARGLYHPAGYELYFDTGPNGMITAIHREARVTQGATAPITWQLRARQRPQRLPNGQPSILLLEDGSALLLASGDTTPLTLQRLNADGTLGYQRSFTGIFSRANLKLAGDQVLVVTQSAHNFLVPGELQLFGIELESGSVNWQHSLTLQAPDYLGSNSAGDVFLDAEAEHALWWTLNGLDYNLQKIRLADGTLMARTDFPCTPQHCRIDRVHVDAVGTTLLPSVTRREHDPFTPRARADQEVLEGAWYQAATSGQGVLFDYIPQTRTWFGTWHTSLGDGRANLRWFTVQGEANADGSEATLGIYLASAGQFDSGPTISSTRIGTARLSFDTCSSANLQYEFSSGELNGKLGSIPLRTLTPHAGSCAALDQPPAQIVASERNGVGTRHSGTWYEPATSGQGIEVAIRPELGEGTVFAGWFTYDPESAADDAQSQHWFTLQGDLSSAIAGSITLPIFRTIGGTFDSSGSRNTHRVGEATWTFASCDQSELSYRFDNSEVAAAFAGRTGTISLQRLGACAPL